MEKTNIDSKTRDVMSYKHVSKKDTLFDITLNFAIPFDQTFTFQYDDIDITIMRQKFGDVVGINQEPTQFETLTLKGFFPKKIEKLIKDAIEYCDNHKHKEDRDHIDIYVYEKNYWSNITSQKKRSIDTVNLSDDIKEKLLIDVELFINDRQLYESCGIPYKRSYLLTGPPGTGKSSIIYAIASKFNLNIGIFKVSSEKQSLEQAYKSLPKKTILLIEDIQHCFPTEHKETYKFDMCELLNVLDGVLVKDQLITFMTSNKIDHIPKVLLRPGRVDETYIFNFSDKKQIIEIYKRFCPTEDSEAFYKVVNKEGLKVTPAILQKFLFRNTKKRIEDLVEIVRNFKEDHNDQFM
jgi:chaperone BCS1